MFDNIKNLTQLLGQAGEIKAKAAEMQEELAKKIVEAEAGAGAVRVVANGKLEIVEVKLDRVMLTALVGDEDDQDESLRMIEDLIHTATNAALKKARDVIQQETAKLTGGLNLPGLDGLLGS